MKLFKMILLFLVLSVAALFTFAYFMGYLDNSQSKACRTLKPGITETDLVAALGAPIDRLTAEGDIWILSFRPDILSSGPLIARVDKKTNKVIRLRCSYDGANTWEITRKAQ